MTNQAPLLTFLNELESDITAEVQPTVGEPGDFRELAFTQIIADELETAGILESPTACHWDYGKGGGSLKVSGYGVPEEDSRLDLFLSIYIPGPHEDVPSINAAEIDLSFKKLERFLAKALTGLHDQMDPALPERHMADRIFQSRSEIDRVNLFIFTNARLAIRRDTRTKAEVSNIPASYEVWDIERLRRLRESGAGYETLTVDLRYQPQGGLPCVRMDSKEEGYRTCVAIFPGALLRDLYDEHGSRLLELNVRSYLQAKGKINKNILETLRRAPEDFMAYNNGITVVAEKIVFGVLTNNQDGILELQGMQIVNGGQTTASIHRASKEFQADLGKVYVQGKIVTVEPARFNDVVPLISRFANSQNKVTEPDLQANHRFHVGLERVAGREWTPDQTSKWFYERARGSYQTARTREGSTEARRREFDRRYPSGQRFSKEDLAKFENCWRGLPYIVNRGGQKNFTQFMTIIKDELGDLPESWEPTPEEFKRYIGKAILFRDTQRLVRSDASITAYRINVTTYLVALLAERTARRIDLDAIWRGQRVTDAIAETIGAWAPVVFKELLDFARGQTVHIDNVLKSQKAWEHMLSVDLKVSLEVEGELISVSSNDSDLVRRKRGSVGEISSDDHNNAARCKEVTAVQWMEIVKWGNGPGQLEGWQLGIATTLASYAAQGWPRAPSVKQAKHGAAIIDAAKVAGFLSR